MDGLEKSKTGFFFFILIVIALIFGGTYLVKNLNKEEKEVKEEINIKLDEDKDYVYNESNECLSVLIPVCYPVIKINIDSEDARTTEKYLNEKMEELDKSYTKISETDTRDLELIYHEDDIFSTKVINYIYHNSAYVLSLSASSYDYYATGDFTNVSEEVFNFDLKTGKLLSNEEVLKLYKLTIDDVIERINRTNKDITELDSYNVMVDKTNNLIINYVATVNGFSYNSSITIYR